MATETARPAARLALSDRKKLTVLGLATLALIALFMVIQGSGMWSYVLPRRGAKILAIVLAGGSIAAATVIFQTITQNRILTPSIIGIDSLYMLVQTAIVFFLGAAHPAVQRSEERRGGKQGRSGRPH